MSLAVVLYWWEDPRSMWRATFTYQPKHVDVVARMVARHLSRPHHTVVVTNRPQRIPHHRTVAMEDRLLIPGSRYPKLMTFRSDAAELFGADELLMLDLDIVVTGSLDPLVNHGHDFMAWHSPRFGRQDGLTRSRFNSSVVYVRAGARPSVYDTFDPVSSPSALKRMGYRVTDQAWMSERVSADEHGWDHRDGIYSYVIDCRTRLPSNAVLVSFHGRRSPHMPRFRRAHSWIREHYR